MAADIKHENHDMSLVFGNEMADAMAKKAASEAAPRGAAAEQVAWVDAMAWREANMQASRDTPTVLTSCGKGLRRAQYEAVLHQLAFRRTRQRNVFSTLAEGRSVQEQSKLCRALEIPLDWE